MYINRVSHVLKCAVRFKVQIGNRLCGRMSNNAILVQKFNPGTGNLEWDLQPENYDYIQEIARSGFADMLHDEERNLKYNLALKKALKSLQTDGKAARVLDIGTGTGLLAMMAAKAQATSITACETFQPMAKCAREVIAHNGFAENIKLVPKRSTDITVGVGKDMEHRANVLITEVFDTELIGEGAIGTFNHAHKSLLSEDSIVIPARASVYVQLIESELVSSWNCLKPIKCQGVINPPTEVFSCPGNGAVHDVQLAQLNSSNFKVLSDPLPVFHFDWNSKEVIPNDESKVVEVVATASGTVHALLFWWTLDMDREGQIILSCAPPWAHPEGNNLPWRDHWMQAIYYLPKDVPIKSKGKKLHLVSYHDEYSLWFGLQNDPPVATDLPRPFCTCSVHLAVSRTRLGQLNDSKRNQKYLQALEKVVNPDTVCLTLGDCCPLGLIAAKLGAKKVYAAERNPHCRRVLESWIETNNLREQIVVLDGELQNKVLDLKVNLVVGEPFFETSVLPWHNLYFTRWKKNVEHLLVDGVTEILPRKAHLYAIAIEMKDLWKIRAPVHSTQEIDLSVFDKLIEGAIESSDSLIEPHPLWEYPSRALSSAIHLMTLDLTSAMGTIEVQGTANLPVAGNLNGVALWIDWQLDDDIAVSQGPSVPVTLGQYVQWDVHSKQAIYFFKQPTILSGNEGKTLNYQVQLTSDQCEFKFNFSV